MEIVIKTPTGDVVSDEIETVLDVEEAALADQDFFEGVFPLGAEGQACREFELGSIKGVQEVMTEMEKQCRKVAGVKICVRVPVVYTRTSTATLFARVCVPSTTTEQAWKKVRDCALSAVAAGGIVAIIGNPAAAIPAAKLTMIGCLKDKALAEIANGFDLGLYTRQVAGEWKRRT